MDAATKAIAAVLTVFALAALGWGMSAAGAEGAAFGLFAFLTLGGALYCVWDRSVVRSAFSLMATFVGTAGLFLMLGSDFLAVAQILIYVGGILALLLFGVMLTAPDLTERKMPRVLGGLAAIGLGVAIVAAKVSATVKWAALDELPAPQHDQAESIGIGFLAPDQYMIAFELAAVVLTVALVAAVYIARRKRADIEPDSTLGGKA
jgi:NADH-quinone oxidoreductase subunit J